MPNQQPKFHHQLARTAAALVVGLAALGGASHAMAAGKTDNSTYRQEAAACSNGSSNQDRATCLREAGAAKYESGRGGLSDPGMSQLKDNAMKRCEGLPQSNREDCIKRMEGGGIAEGTARDGGILRETVTIVPGQPGSNR